MRDITFLNENAVRARIQELFRSHFAFTRRLLAYWLEADTNRGFQNSTVTPLEKRILLSRNVAICRHFRSVIELCERAEASCAEMPSRAMFDLNLALGFVVEPKFTPRTFNGGKKAKRLGSGGKKLTPEFRAKLYAAFHLFQSEKFGEKNKDRHGYKKLARRWRSGLDKKITNDWEREIGPIWTSRLKRNPNTYSGLTTADLARSLGRHFDKWYRMVYPFQCESVHGADLADHIQFLDDGTTTSRWHSDVVEIAQSLRAGVAMFLGAVEMLNRRLEFGIAVSTAMSAFEREWTSLSERLPSRSIGESI